MYIVVKRLIDVILATLGLVIVSPLFLIVMLLLILTGEGEIFYLQKRIGFKNQYFNIIKFATMVKDSLNIGSGSITLRDDPRVTSVGKYLRRTKLNELPQLINILKDDMSVVGPRPLVDKTFLAYDEQTRQLIYNAKPGITGVGSIVFRDEEKMLSTASISPGDFYNEYIAPYKGELELWYLKNRSIGVDLVLIGLTVWYVLFSESNLIYKVFPSLPQKPV
jgi:lipopolysaccharide/colanic/teichoic acid biosynthesis glycosyltransferase